MASLSVEYDDTFQKWYCNFVLNESIYCICQLATLFFIQSRLYVYNLIWASKKNIQSRFAFLSLFSDFYRLLIPTSIDQIRWNFFKTHRHFTLLNWEGKNFSYISLLWSTSIEAFLPEKKMKETTANSQIYFFFERSSCWASIFDYSISLTAIIIMCSISSFVLFWIIRILHVQILDIEFYFVSQCDSTAKNFA